MLIGNDNICPLCFEKMSYDQNECYRCNGVSNREKYPTALEETTILNGKYLVGKVLGRGGFGVTYLCYDIAMKTKIAIKEFFPNTLAHRDTGSTFISLYEDDRGEDFLKGSQSFINEAHTISSLSYNDNIVKVYDFFYENNTAYYAMEYLEGKNMKAYMKSLGRNLTEQEVFRIISDIFPAVSAVHSLNFLHRDISPDNIFICNDGRVKLIDFGASRQFMSRESQSLTVVLKHGFAPFEQYKTHGNQGPWTDVYSLGATIYYALTGKVLLDAPSRTDSPYIDMTGISAGVAEILNTMLSVHIESRYKSVHEVEIALKAALENQSQSEGAINTYGPYDYNDVSENGNSQPGGNGNTGGNNNSKVLKTVLAVAGCIVAFVLMGFVFFSHGSRPDVEKNEPTETVSKTENTNTKTAVAVIQGDDVKLLDGKGKELFTFDSGVTDVSGFVNGIAGVEKDGKWGIINSEGEMIHDYIFDYEPTWDDDVTAASVCKDEKYALMNNEGEIVTDFIYDSILFSEGIIVKKGEKYGLLNSMGDEIVPTDYSNVIVENNTVTVTNEDNSGYTHRFESVENGSLYNCTETIPEALFPVEQNDKHGYENIDGEIVIPYKWDSAHSFYEGYAVVYTDYGYTFIDTEGNVAFDDSYAYANDFGCGLGCVKNEKREWGYIDKNGEIKIDLTDKYSYVSDFYPRGHALVKNDEYYGAIDTDGNLFADVEYSWISYLTENLFRVEKDEKYGLIDMSGNSLLPIEYESIIYSYYWSDCLIEAEKDEQEQYFSCVDGAVYELVFDDVIEYSNGYFVVVKDEKQGVVDQKGNVVIPAEYDEIHVGYAQGIFAVKDDNNKWGCIDKNGKTVIDFKYDNMNMPGTY